MSGEPIFIARKHGTESDDLASLVVLEDGTVLLNDSTLYVERNTIPERIANAAAGGMDPRNIPPGVKVHFCDDVRIRDFGTSWGDGPWITIEPITDDEEPTAELAVPALSDEVRNLVKMDEHLHKQDLTLRCVIFEADIVNREAEPAPARQARNYIQELVNDGFFGYHKVAVSAGGMAGQAHSYIAGLVTDELGYSSWDEVPFAAIDEWMKHHGLLSLAPDWWEEERARLDHDEALVSMFSGAQWDADQLAGFDRGEKPDNPVLVNLIVPKIRPGQPYPDDHDKRRAWAESLPVIEGGLCAMAEPARLSMMPIQGDDWLAFTYEGDTWEIVHDPKVGWARRRLSL